MSEAFLNPSFLPLAAALISVPIIIHLINRLRFKRIAWAAMEFLLKAQKRNRRRLIIEQLILLALRCLLVALVGLLVLRFIGMSLADIGVKQSIHLVLLDDSLSMNDRWKKGDGYNTAFNVAKDELLLGKIATKLGQEKTPQQLVVVPLSAVLEEKDLKTYVTEKGYIYEKLNAREVFEKLKKDMAQLTPTKMHLKLIDGIKRLPSVVGDDTKTKLTVHVLSDFRKADWGVEESAALHKELVTFAKQRKADINLLDTVGDPTRIPGSHPPARNNIGLVELKPRSRMVGKNMPVTFTLSIANYGPDTEVNIDIFEHSTGQRRAEVDFIPSLPLKLKAKEITQATFEIKFDPKELEERESYFAAISARLRNDGNLEKDGLQEDNAVFGVVEVREQVPILIIDGLNAAGHDDKKKGRDSFFLDQAYRSVPGAGKEDDEPSADSVRPFRVDFPWREIKNKKGEVVWKPSPDAATFLETGDLRQYPAIMLTNVPQLTQKQLQNLENYVNEGGGLGIFMGPLVNTKFYNESMYRKGQGLFPAELQETYYPAENNPRLEPIWEKGVPMVLLREDDPKLRPLPIFGSIFTHHALYELLDMMPVHRYFKVKDRPWLSDAPDKEHRRVFELATLPNINAIENYQEAVMNIVRERTAGKASELQDLLDMADFRKYSVGFDPHRKRLKELVEFSGEKPYALSVALEKMMRDRGTGAAGSVNLEEFWNNSDPKVQSLHNKVKRLLDKVRYLDGAPFVLASNFGKGRVVTIMTTAGNHWQQWAGGTSSTAVYQPFIWEMQNYLSAQGSDINMKVGERFEARVPLESLGQRIDPKRALDPKRFEMFRFLLKETTNAPAVAVDDQGKPGKGKGTPSTEKEKTLTYAYPPTKEPGVYLIELFDNEAKKKSEAAGTKEGDMPISTSAAVYNVDTAQEGNLERVDYETIKVNVLDKATDGSTKRIAFAGPEVDPNIIVKPSIRDLSEMPLLFLLFLTILVAEQALAVHLSYHLKGTETYLPAGQPQQPQQAIAA